MLSDRFRYQTLVDYAEAPHVVEDAGTFAGNATKKAVELARWVGSRLGLPPGTDSASNGWFCLADDSGLEVDALNGAPGVHSARFAALDSSAEANSSDAENNAKLLRLLADTPPERRTARFRCVLALVPVPDQSSAAESSSPVCYADELELRTELFDGVCEGTILLKPKGAHGFGYDPLFVPAGYSETFGELPDSTKNQISHRARALAKLQDWLRQRDVGLPR